MDDEQRIDSERRKKAENFQLNIDGGEYSDTVISSYSNPDEALNKTGNMTDPASLKRAQEAHEFRNKEKGRKNKNFFRLIWIIMVLLVSLLIAQYLVTGMNDMLAVGRSNTKVTVDIPKNATSQQVAQLLYKSGAIRNTAFFNLYAKLTKAPKNYSGGSYQILSNMDYLALINSIQSSENRVDTVKLTFREGLNALEIASMFEKNGVCSSKDALKAFGSNEFDEDYDMLKDISNSTKRYYKLEGYLFPDTYEFFKNEGPEQAVKKLISNCNKKLTKQIRDKAKEKGMTLDQVLTLASMIQAEAADKNDMYSVSSVFHNRMNSSRSVLKRLSSDPTMYYPYRKLELVPANIRDTFKSSYNTYTIEGLPPGPICNPGMDAIDAALNPSSTNYYYFCHDTKGKAYYASTSAQHNKNLKKAGLR